MHEIKKEGFELFIYLSEVHLGVPPRVQLCVGRCARLAPREAVRSAHLIPLKKKEEKNAPLELTIPMNGGVAAEPSRASRPKPLLCVVWLKMHRAGNNDVTKVRPALTQGGGGPRHTHTHTHTHRYISVC